MKRKTLALLIASIVMIVAIPCFAYAAESADAEWWNYRNNYENNGVTNRETPIEYNETSILWSKKLGDSYTNSCTPPLIIDGYIYTASRRTLYKVDKKTGDVIDQSEELAGGLGFALNPLVYAEGKIFIQIGNGQIQALDAKTLDSVWVSERIGGQTLSPITYRNGYIYTGYWQQEDMNGYYAGYTVEDEDPSKGDEIKTAKWKVTPEDLGSEKPKGFYWAGSYASDNYVAFGSDDGENNGFSSGEGFTNTATFYSVHPKTGVLIDKIENIKGDIRTTVVYNNGYLYFATKGGHLYKVEVSEDGHFINSSYIDLDGMITATPIVHNGRIYVGVCGKGGQFDADAGHHFAVVNDTEQLSAASLAYTVLTRGYPQAAALLSTQQQSVDADGDGNPDNKVYLYFTYNAPPGGIYVLEDQPGQTSGKADFIYKPETTGRQYSISTICCDREGNLYYKNDSGYLMAVSKNRAYLNDIKVTPSTGKTTWNEDFITGTLNYDILTSESSTNVKIELDVPEGQTAYINDEEYTEPVTVNYEEFEADNESTKERIEPKIRVEKGEDSREYKLHIEKAAQVKELKDIQITKDPIYGENKVAFTEKFNEDKLYNETIEIPWGVEGDPSTQANYVNIWPIKKEINSKIVLFPRDGVKDKNIEDGKIIKQDTPRAHDRYQVHFEDGATEAKVLVRCYTENEEEYNTYTLVLVRDAANRIAPTVVNSFETGSDYKTGKATWDEVPDATKYYVYYKKSGDTECKRIETTKTSASVPLTPGKKNYVYVKAVKAHTNGKDEVISFRSNVKSFEALSEPRQIKELEDIKISNNNNYDEELINVSPKFESNFKNYKTDEIGMDKDSVNIWPVRKDNDSILTLYPRYGVTSDGVKDGKIQVTETVDGNPRYEVHFEEGVSQAEVLVRCYCENKNTYNTYTMVLVRDASIENIIKELGSFKFNKSSKSKDAIRIRWSKADNADGYIIYRSNISNGHFTRFAKVNKDTFEYRDSKLKSNTRYYYKVCAYRKNIVNGKSVYVKKYLKATGYTTKKSSISSENIIKKLGSFKFNKSSKSRDAIRTRWSKSNNADGYIIYRATTSNGHFTRLAKVNKDTFEFRNSKLKSNTRYYYKVCAYRKNIVNGKAVYTKKYLKAKRYTTKIN